jgi:hypothetical protein
LQANGIAAQSPAAIKTWLSQRRNYILQELDNVAANFEFTVNGGNNFSTAQNLVTLTGTAPVQVKTIKINGVTYPVTWTGVTQWTLHYALGPGVNALNLQAYDSYGNLIGSLSDSISITYTGTPQLPQDHLVINEIMYNPAAPEAEFVEIHNRSTFTAFDLSNYRLAGVDFNFPEGTIIPSNGYVLAVENHAAFLNAYGTGLPVAGVYSGKLDNGGERLRLVRPGATPAEDLLIDEVTYDDDPPWPVLADGFGPSLQLIDSAQDNNRIANWTAVAGSGGTETNTIFGITGVWKYEQSGTDLGTAWRQPGYNDTAWPSGAALLYVATADLPAPKNTQLTFTSPQQTTFYFRKSFTFNGNPATTTLTANFVLDDGAVVYLNGVEVLRVGMPPGVINYNTFSSRTITTAAYEGPFNLPAAALVAGVNVLAVEVHQASSGSSDIVFGMTLDAVWTLPAPYTPGAPNSVATNLPPIPLVWVNELQVQNVTGPQDNFGQRDPWVELYNSSPTPLTLTNFYLTDTYTNLTRWAFPAGATLNPGEFKLVWLDGQPEQTSGSHWHAGFAAPAPTGAVALVQVANNRTSIVDYLNYNLPVADRSYGAFPDGTPTRRTRFYVPTPGAPNSDGYPEVPVVINEWMAGNTSTINDPLDGKFSDWFELYNAGSEPVDLSGFTLTDNLSNPTKSIIPDGFVIQPGEYLLVWADSEPQQNGQGSHLHADFALSLGGEALGLYAPNGFPIHTLTFGPQTNDISEGFWPDGGGNRYFMPTPTPGAPNQIPNQPNLPPTLASIGNKTVNELALLSFTVSATDPDAQQTLTYSLDEGAPAGAAINSESGVFTWTPTEAQGPNVYGITIRVTDNGTPSLSDFETISVTVNEVNVAPVLHPIGNRTVNEETLLTFTALASDSDLPANTLTFSLDEGAPAGAAINPNSGVFTWTPTAQQAPGVYPVTIVVTDNGTPPLNASETIHVTVNNVTLTAPVLSLVAMSNGFFSFQVSGDAGPDYVIERSPALVPANWVPVFTNVSPTLPFQWSAGPRPQPREPLNVYKILPRPGGLEKVTLHLANVKSGGERGGRLRASRVRLRQRELVADGVDGVQQREVARRKFRANAGSLRLRDRRRQNAEEQVRRGRHQRNGLLRRLQLRPEKLTMVATKFRVVPLLAGVGVVCGLVMHRHFLAGQPVFPDAIRSLPEPAHRGDVGFRIIKRHAEPLLRAGERVAIAQIHPAVRAHPPLESIRRVGHVVHCHHIIRAIETVHHVRDRPGAGNRTRAVGE